MVWTKDRVVIEDAPGSGRGTAWSLDSPPKKLAEKALLFDRAALKPAEAARFEALERTVLKPFGLAIAEPLDVVPDPYLAKKWRLYDADGDGKHESAWAGTTVLIDPKQALEEPVSKAPIALVRKERRAWV